MHTRFLSTVLPSPFGEVTCYAGQNGLSAIVLKGQDAPLDLGLSTPITLEHTEEDARNILRQARAELGEYFRGERTRFDVKIDPSGTYYDRRVWAAVAKIKAGQRKPEPEILDEVGMTTARAAVSHSIERCPLPFIIPSHMVRPINPHRTFFSHGRKIGSMLMAGEIFLETVRALETQYQVPQTDSDRNSVCEGKQFANLMYSLGVTKPSVRSKFSDILSYLDISAQRWGKAGALIERYCADYKNQLGKGPLQGIGVIRSHQN